MNLYRYFFSKFSVKHKVSKSQWELQFSEGHWDYLDLNSLERSRNAVIGMFCNFFYKKGKILDVGCGLCTIVDFLNDCQKKKYLGIDLSREAIKKAKEKSVEVLNVDFFDFNPKEKYNIIILNEVLYYMDIENAIKQVQCVLAKDGKIIISMFQLPDGYDKKIWKSFKKAFSLIEEIEISSRINHKSVGWKLGVLENILPRP